MHRLRNKLGAVNSGLGIPLLPGHVDGELYVDTTTNTTHMFHKASGVWYELLENSGDRHPYSDLMIIKQHIDILTEL